ncbi:MAG: hypothetical protein LBD06_02965 [Candidatus Accumulibacter sp.]|nr:hypothetical protein [Accumulibacter sp.]
MRFPFIVEIRRQVQNSEDRSLRRQKTENPSARFFLPHPARSAQADLSSIL